MTDPQKKDGAEGWGKKQIDHFVILGNFNAFWNVAF